MTKLLQRVKLVVVAHPLEARNQTTPPPAAVARPNEVPNNLPKN
jgi:hypothetical protein